MRIGIISDLHMESGEFYFEPRPDVDIYVCAGDIHSNRTLLDLWVKAFPDVFWVAGNHDFYYSTFPTVDQPQWNKTLEKDGVKFAGATLWTDLSYPLDWVQYIHGLVDFRYINNLTQENYVARHELDKKFLLSSGADVIVSHHCPTLGCIHPKFKDSHLNMCFSNNLENEILALENPPKVWICGHTHEELDFMVGKTRVIVHPRGYPKEQWWYKTYQPKVIDI